MAYSWKRRNACSKAGDTLKTAKLLESSDPAAIAEAARIIRSGGLVVFPTETVYGLGADACNPLAVARIFEVKQRPRMDPLIVHVADAESARLYGHFPEGVAAELMRRFWPGPLTLVVPKSERIPPIVTAGLPTVAIRMPAHEAALALIRTAGCALAAPSANPFGRVSPTEAGHISEYLAERIDLILDGGRCAVGVESTVLALTGGPPRILRAGGIPPEALREILGPLEWPSGRQDRPQSPGQLTRHYATITPLEILKEGERRADPRPGERVGLLTLTSPRHPEKYAAVEVLSETGDLRAAAANLFAALHRLDKQQLDRIAAHAIPEHGLGIAIMDRLRRCAAGSGSRSASE
jgi:L-threonylcarbamoyladenylate synthase